jgi:hypothetical protein
MFAGRGRLALALSLALPGAALAQGFEYAPGTGTYRVVQNMKIAQNIMGQKQEFETSSNQVISVTVARASKDTVALNLVLDSISATNSMGLPTNMIERLMGMKVAAKISPTGSFYSAKGPSEEAMPNSATITDAMARLLPKLRRALAKGDSWTDTTSGSLKQEGMEIERRTVSKYTVEGDTTVGAEKSLKVVRVDSTSLTGSGNGPSGPMTMEGTTKGTGALVVSPKGVFLGGAGTEEAVLKIVLASNGMEIGMTQNATTKVEKIK